MTTVLHIEDDTQHCRMVSAMLTSQGFSVETAQDGLAGLEKAREMRPDLILLDLLLPAIDGFGVIKRLQEDSVTRDIPIVVISAWPTADNRKRVHAAGARGFITKPFQIRDLIKIIRQSLPELGAGSAKGQNGADNGADTAEKE